MHNWTGNYMVYDSNALRFYGSGPFIWYNTTPNGGQWNGFINTNIQGGDPSVVKISENNYLMVFVGSPYSTNTDNNLENSDRIVLYPNPVKNKLEIRSIIQNNQFAYKIYNSSWQIIETGKNNSASIQVEHLTSGLYFIEIQSANNIPRPVFSRFVKE
jgi:hypothetical protein